MPDNAEPASPPADPVRAEHNKTATVIFATGEVKWLPSRDSAALVTAENGRRATERDLRIAGLPL